MARTAFWLSKKETVEVEQILEKTQYARYATPKFQARLQDGSKIMIDRSDIILDEEQAMIDELAQILYHSKQPGQHERYAYIMRQFIVNGVPYVNRLQTSKPQQQTLDFFHAG